MIKRGYIFFFVALSGAVGLCSNNGFAAQTATVQLPVTMTVTNPQCSINAGKGLPDTVQLPVVTTAGVFPDGNNAEVPIVISCAGSVSKFEITLTGGMHRKSLPPIAWLILRWRGKKAELQFSLARLSP